MSTNFFKVNIKANEYELRASEKLFEFVNFLFYILFRELNNGAMSFKTLLGPIKIRYVQRELQYMNKFSNSSKHHVHLLFDHFIVLTEKIPIRSKH